MGQGTYAALQHLIIMLFSQTYSLFQKKVRFGSAIRILHLTILRFFSDCDSLRSLNFHKQALHNSQQLSKKTLRDNLPVVPISIHEVPARFTSRITDVKRLGLFLRSIRCLLRQCAASAALNPWSLLAPLPADGQKRPFGTVVSPAAGSPPSPHTVSVSNRISLPRRKLLVAQWKPAS